MIVIHTACVAALWRPMDLDSIPTMELVWSMVIDAFTYEVSDCVWIVPGTMEGA